MGVSVAACNGRGINRAVLQALYWHRHFSADRKMLILTRRPGESLYLGEDIRITVLGLQGKQVKLGFDVPAETTVYREEVYKRVIEENRKALEASNEDFLVAAELWH